MVGGKNTPMQSWQFEAQVIMIRSDPSVLLAAVNVINFSSLLFQALSPWQVTGTKVNDRTYYILGKR